MNTSEEIDQYIINELVKLQNNVVEKFFPECGQLSKKELFKHHNRIARRIFRLADCICEKLLERGKH